MADQEKKQLFREKSLETIESPESLNEYLHVTSPGVWLLLAALIVFLIGVCVWGVFGTLQTTTTVAIVNEKGKSICLIPESDVQTVVENPVVTVDGKEVELTTNMEEPRQITEETNMYITVAGGLSVGDIVYPIELEEKVTDDITTGTVVTEVIRPISFLLN